MVEVKVLKSTEHEGKKIDRGEIIELPPREAVELIERGVARTASWSDFSDY